MIDKEFWIKYKDLDYFEKRDAIKSLPLLENFKEICKDFARQNKFDLLEYMTINLFKDYIDDVIETFTKETGDE